MPFLMKMDSFLPNTKNTTARITKNSRFTQTIWTIFRYRALRKQMFHPYSVRLFSALFQSDTNMLRQAKTIIAVLNACGIPKSCSLSSNTISIISIPSNRSTAMGKHNLETISLSSSSESSRSPVFSNSSSRSGVMHRTIFNTFGPKNSVLSILSPTFPNTIAMFTTKATMYRPQIWKRQPRYSASKNRKKIQTKTAGPKEKTMRYQLDVPS